MLVVGRRSTRGWLGVWAAGLLLGGACSVVKPEEPVDRTPQACCTWGDFELQHFKGCRIPQRDCRSSKGERYWMRGYVTCGAVDEANCDGGRCCEYKPQYANDLAEPIENWSPPGFAEPSNNVTKPPIEPAAATTPAPDAAPAPARAEPTPASDEAGRTEPTPAAPKSGPASAPEDDPEAPLP